MKKYNLHISLPSLNKLLLLLFFFSFTLSTFAATKTWDGSESSDWNTKANWVGNKVPGPKDKVIIPTGLSNYPIIGSGDDITAKEITINSGGSLQIDDGSLDILKIKNSGTFIQNGGAVSAKDMELKRGGTLTLTGGALTVSKSLKIDGGTFNQSGGNVSAKDMEVKGSGTSTVSNGDLSITGKLKVDGGTFDQDGGTVTTKDLEIKNNGNYDQSAGEINISHDFKVPTDNTFLSTGGIVHFTGKAGRGADYQGDIQFHDIIIDAKADPKFDNDNNVNINVSGDYENNNSGLRVTKATFTFNGSGDQSIFSASTSANSCPLRSSIFPVGLANTT